MLLNSIEIQNENVIKNSSIDNFKEASYNLRIGKIVDHEGNELNTIQLGPQGLITVISEEVLDVPSRLLLIATVKNGLSQKGVLALNIGLIDSGWQGPINSTIINFGKGSITLSKGDVFLRLTAYKYNALPKTSQKPIPAIYNTNYLEKTKTDIRAYLGEKFLSLDLTSKEIEKNVENSIWEGIKKAGAILGLISTVGLIIAIIGFFINRVSDATDQNNKIILLESNQRNQTKEISNLERQLKEDRDESNKKLEELLKRTDKTHE